MEKSKVANLEEEKRVVFTRDFSKELTGWWEEFLLRIVYW